MFEFMAYEVMRMRHEEKVRKAERHAFVENLRRPSRPVALPGLDVVAGVPAASPLEAA